LTIASTALPAAGTASSCSAGTVSTSSTSSPALLTARNLSAASMKAWSCLREVSTVLVSSGVAGGDLRELVVVAHQLHGVGLEVTSSVGTTSSLSSAVPLLTLPMLPSVSSDVA
jgi:hypothetical protein